MPVDRGGDQCAGRLRIQVGFVDRTDDRSAQIRDIGLERGRRVGVRIVEYTAPLAAQIPAHNARAASTSRTGTPRRIGKARPAAVETSSCAAAS
ncbi:unnamed protein product [Sordaria macrospora k-hell]|uniref:WGS project CABT00000000 data, contig 2.736 n=1 Tax=Sordaria macrospora (strain ATCC MYA-333 / DSM 997 / K(L3346) / K-hell) TaxID=771870 RepID=F7WD15_SORMK|nr:unnamed protein product [Sordaria macrospora k-hell]